ncbi:spore germination protein [Paenibacillus terrae]|uniref:spore germination protein n=1 Tax=Paenibacillus terrae TaxID=159743 RepID=UPI0011EB6169|nr:spore germination protein [Paenibacillus terrae]
MEHRPDQEHQEEGAIGREGYTAGEEEMSPWKKRQAQESERFKHKKESERSDNVEESVRYWQGEDDISPRMKDNRDTLKTVIGLGETFDVVFREMTLGGRHIGYLFLNTFAKDLVMIEVLKRLTYLTPDDLSTDGLQSYFENYIPHIQVEKTDKMSVVINKVLTGYSAFFMEGERFSIILDTRNYPVRNPEEPSLERVVRGARDGFTETMLTNVGLVRRRLRDPGLKFEAMQVGRRTRTDVCLGYIDDIVDKVMVDTVRDKIKNVNLDGIPLADKQLEETIINKGWNPYPLVRYSERPDVVASHIMEGRLVIFVDTSPSVMILPTTFFDLCQHAEENRQTAFMGSYLRWVRFIGIFASMFLLPMWLLMVINPELKPAFLDFIGPQKEAHLPLIAQFIIVELGVDLMRMAAVHTPTPLASAMGLIAAILVGDIAVKTGLFVNEVVLYMAVAAIGMFATPSYELGLANRLIRLVLLIAVAIFHVPGFIVGTTLIILMLTLHRSYNSSYLWPFIPFNAKAMASILFRMPVLSSTNRPSSNKTRDNTRMPGTDANTDSNSGNGQEH